MENVVRGVMDNYHFMSFTEYKSVLSKFNVAAEETKGSLYGKPFNGVIYSATDDNDNKVGNPFPSTAFGKYAGIKELEKKYATSKETMLKKRMLTQLRAKIDSAFTESTSKDQLRLKLFERGVGVTFRENTEGRLYGVTYIDHTTGATLNGSRLGKNYAANMVTERLQNSSVMAQQSSNRDTNALNVSQPNTPSHEQESSQEYDQTSSLVGGALGLFDMPSSGDTDIDDIENDQMARNLQQKKKRGRRM